MDPERVVKFIRSRVILIFILSFYFAQSHYSLAPANAGELDETLKKLLSTQQNKHKEDEVLNKLKKDPQSIEELFSSKQGILSKSSVFKKASASKNVKKTKKTAVKKAAVKKDEESQEPESLEDILTAQSLIVLDESTGKLVYSKDPFKKMAPASLTKIITAIALLDSNKDLNAKVTIKHDIIIRSDGVALGLKEGDQTTLMDLLYMAMLYSANDACVAIAEEVSGSVSKFAQLMNEKAKEIGALNSNFVNPNGMPDSRHYSTAYDLAVLSSYAMKNPIFAKVVGTKKRSVKLLTHKEVTVKTAAASSKKSGKSKTKAKIEKVTKIVEATRTINLSNRHKLLGKTEGVRGIKTGYTKAAGRCLATAYSSNGKSLIIVVLKGKDVNSDTMALIDCDRYLNASSIAVKSSAEKPAGISGGSFPQQKNVTLSTISIR
ncbi:MAG TPA: hypothetical protein PKL57_18220 [Candidatus Wallbacteria bacterium]|nr:hypothetical protein [Candidatus Wallbacteria bacterium]